MYYIVLSHIELNNKELRILNFVWVPIDIDLVQNFKKVDSNFIIHFSNLVRVQFIFPGDSNHVCRIFIDASLVFESGYWKHYTPFSPSTIFSEITEGQNELNQINYENIGKTFPSTKSRKRFSILAWCITWCDILCCKMQHSRKRITTGPYKCFK